MEPFEFNLSKNSSEKSLLQLFIKYGADVRVLKTEAFRFSKVLPLLSSA